MKFTKANIKVVIQRKLSTDDRWALRALERIYALQTSSEKASHSTYEVNNVGFSGADAEILSSFAEQYRQRGSLSPKQMELLRKRIVRYHGQIARMIPVDVLERMVIEA